MSDNKNNLTGFNFMLLWFGAAMSIAEIMTGGLLAPMGFKNGVIVILIGHAVGVTILILGGIIGTCEKIPAIMSTRISFGLYGSYIFSVLNILQLVGWTAIMIISGGRSLNLISKTIWGFDNIALWSLVIGALICIWIALGVNGLKKLNIVAVLLLFALTIVLSVVVFKNGSLFTKQVVGDMSFGGAFELNIIMPLSWLPLIADYTRFAKSKRGAVTGSLLGYFIGSSWMYIIGLGAAILFNNTDVGSIMIAANLGITALLIVALSTVTTTFLDAYSAGITFLNVFPRIKEKWAAMAMAVVGIVLALIMPIEQYENFLYAIGSVFAPLFAILFTDYFIVKKQKNIQEDVLLNFGAVIVWIFGIVLYYKIINIDFILGSTVPVMVITSFVYCVLWKWISKWKYMKR
ncbi:putative hydroxymethylpyrimidine transporter CytX [Clostridium sp. cel8]|jgi:putative hydroxymethylpyrimidine transporter CytX|uniref:putative hydroxymethylpyrimidine transporter CytX n=1 Tax=Clostridium sp. cel8 TaxID=2663123 RepID=UPI0015F783CA|nr:putative hydroxymethylpyrimidine transporter CytX [Clostridium sp. cel8]MBA5851272.1 putative hydroxymethylpyrimidine transporter CytX [Clostridium sp. cel8]